MPTEIIRFIDEQLPTLVFLHGRCHFALGTFYTGAQGFFALSAEKPESSAPLLPTSHSPRTIENHLRGRKIFKSLGAIRAGGARTFELPNFCAARCVHITVKEDNVSRSLSLQENGLGWFGFSTIRGERSYIAIGTEYNIALRFKLSLFNCYFVNKLTVWVTAFNVIYPCETR